MEAKRRSCYVPSSVLAPTAKLPPFSTKIWSSDLEVLVLLSSVGLRPGTHKGFVFVPVLGRKAGP